MLKLSFCTFIRKSKFSSLAKNVRLLSAKIADNFAFEGEKETEKCRFQQISQTQEMLLQKAEKETFALRMQKNFAHIEQLALKRENKHKRLKHLEFLKNFTETRNFIAPKHLYSQLSVTFKQPQDSRFCYVSILGVPNAGKSTLLNQIVDKKVTPVSSKSQTTRSQLLCLWSKESVQIAFLDTPGIPIHGMERSLPPEVASSPWKSLDSADKSSETFGSI